VKPSHSLRQTIRRVWRLSGKRGYPSIRENDQLTAETAEKAENHQVKN